jgi:hypothetical protein
VLYCRLLPDNPPAIIGERSELAVMLAEALLAHTGSTVTVEDGKPMRA